LIYKEVEMSGCLALLTERYVPINLLVETIFVSIVDGRLKAHEVYDIFFKPNANWKDVRILGVSPHKLSDGDQLKVKVSVTPGAGGSDDVFYKDLVLYSGSFDSGTENFTVTLPAHGGPFDTNISEYKGKVIEPTLNTPRRIAECSAATQIMDEFGTIFEINCPNLEAGNFYAIRLILDPLELLALPDKRPLDVREIDEVVSRWMQDASIICPKTCHFNFVELVLGARNDLERSRPDITVSEEELKKLETAIDGVNRLLAVINNAALRLMPVTRQQLVLILPRGAELVARTCDGYVWFTNTQVLKDGRIAAVWEAGSEQYWRDDPETIAHFLYDYFKNYGNVPQCAKKKEEASEAIDAPHDNCSLIVDSLCQEGALRDVGGGKYIVISKQPEELTAICQAVACSEKVYTEFKWKGFQVRYSLQYRYLSKEDADIIKKIRSKRDLSYLLAIIGVILALISILLSIISFLR